MVFLSRNTKLNNPQSILSKKKKGQEFNVCSNQIKGPSFTYQEIHVALNSKNSLTIFQNLLPQNH